MQGRVCKNATGVMVLLFGVAIQTFYKPKNLPFFSVMIVFLIILYNVSPLNADLNCTFGSVVLKTPFLNLYD